MKKRCFSKLYDFGARECQVCDLALNCYDAYVETSPRTPVRKKGEEIAILQILTETKNATLADIKGQLTLRFGSRDVNIYYYLDKLKEQGLLDVRIDGRQRFYSRR